MKKKILTGMLAMMVAISSINLCTEVKAASGTLNIVEQADIAQGTKIFKQIGDSFTVSQNASKTETFQIQCNKTGRYDLRYDNPTDKDTKVTIGVNDGGYATYKTIKPFAGFTGGSNGYIEANLPLQLKAGKTYIITVKKQTGANTTAKKLNYTLSIEKQPTVKSIYVDNDAYVVQAGGFNWWGIAGWAFVVTYSDGSVQHLFGPRGYHQETNDTEPYLPYDDYGNSFTFIIKNNNQEADFYNMVGGSYPVTITVSSGKVFQDVLKIQSNSYQVKYSTGDTFWEGAYKYKITGKSEVAFAGIKSSSIENVVIPENIKIGQKTYKVTSISKKVWIGTDRVFQLAQRLYRRRVMS